MHIIVCVKQVPDTTEVRIDPVTGTMIRAGVPSILNPDDKNALEAALQIRDGRADVTVTALTMGPQQAGEMLRECLAMGADRAVLLCDRAFAGGDTWATSNALAAAVRKLAPYDLVLAGQQAIDGDTAQVGPQLAERLGVPQITYVQQLLVQDGAVRARRALEDGWEDIEAPLPVLLTAIKELNTPRDMSVRGIYDAFGDTAALVQWCIEDLEIDPGTVGLKASPTRVKRSFSPSAKGEGVLLQGSAAEMAEELTQRLARAHVI